MMTFILYVCYSVIISCQLCLVVSAPCQNNEHANLETGKWVLTKKNKNEISSSSEYHSNKIESGKSFYCCDDLATSASGLQSKDEAYCAPLPPKESAELKVWLQGNSTFMAPCGGHACSCSHRVDSKLTMTDQELYTWQPSTCELSHWDSSEFCSLLGNRIVLLSGDSTMYQCASTLMSMLTHSMAPCTEQIYFGRSDYLYIRRAGEKRFDEYIEDIRPDIAVITAGAWLQDHGDLQNVFNEEDKYINKLKAKSDEKLPRFVWKTQNPGHVKCSHYAHPISKYLYDDMEKFHKEKIVKPAGLWTGLDPYYWHMHPDFDALAKEWASARNYPVLDMSPLYLRPDSHAGKLVYENASTDCLHYCLPGPLDLFARVLLQMLKNKEI